MKVIGFWVNWFFCLGLTLSIGNTGFAQTTSDYKTGELYVKFTNWDKTIPQDLSSPGALSSSWDSILQVCGMSSFTRAFPLLDYAPLKTAYKLKFSNSIQEASLYAWISQQPEVEYVEKVPDYHLVLTPNDPSFTANTTTQWGLYKIQAQQAWNITTGSASAIVAVVDDAVKITHQDLIGNLWTNPLEIAGNGIDDDQNGYIDDVNGWDAADLDNNPNPPGTATNSNFTHGTHCAGIVAAKTNNAIGVASIGFNITYIPVKCKLSSTSGSSIQAAMEGVQYAINTPAKIISMSWGSGGSSSVEQMVFDYAWQQGIALIAAAGNNGNQVQFYPANYNHVLAIGNTASSDARSTSSNYGNWLDLMAPGTTIYNCLAGSNSSYGNQTGTSMATPMVAGAAGLLISVNPGLTPDDIYKCLQDSADNIDAQNPTILGLIGSGRLNAFRSLGCAVAGVVPIARFTSNNNQVCAGSPVQFTDLSYNTPTSWVWTFQGGTPATSTLQNPIVSWAAPGTYSVTLEAINTRGRDTSIQAQYMVVIGGGQPLPFSEDFESNSLQTNNWFVDNPDSSFTWDIATTGGNPRGGVKSGWMNFYDYATNGRKDGLVTPSFDFSPYSSVGFRFSRAFRQIPNRNDSLVVKISTDCGVTWPNTLLRIGGNTLGTASTLNSAFTPSNASHWCGSSVTCDSFNLIAYAGQPQVRIRFEGINNYGNHLYIDDVNLVGVPKANFSANQTLICAGQSVNFSDLSTGGAIGWNWTLAGSTTPTSTTASPTVTYANPGTYAVSLSVTGSYGSHTLSRTGYIVVATQPNVNVTAPIQPLCSNSAPVTLTTSPVGGSLTGPGISGLNFDPVLAGVGTHRVYYQFTSPQGCSGIDSADINVSVATPGSITGIAGTLCETGSAVSLSGSPAGGSFSGIGIIGSQFSPSQAGSGSHTIHYNYTDISGCAGMVSQVVTVQGLVTPVFANPTAVCRSDAPVALAATPAGGTFTGSGISANSFDPSLAGVGTHTLQYAFTSGSCSYTASTTMQVKAIPVVSFSAPAGGPWCQLASPKTLTGSPTGGVFSGIGVSGNSFNPTLASVGMNILSYQAMGTNGCYGSDTAQVWITAPPAPLINQGSIMNICGVGYLDVNAPGSLQWYLNGSPITGATGPKIYPTVSGNYTVSQLLNGCQGTSLPITVSWLPYVKAKFSYNMNGLNLSFVNQSQNGTTYNWDFGQGSPSTLSSPSFTYAYPSVYIVTLTAMNDNCFDVFKDTITVGNVSIQSEVLPEDWKVYPQPMEESFTIESSGSIEPAALSLVNLSGQEVWKGACHGGKESFQVNLPSGSYVLSILLNDSKTYRMPILIRK